MLLGNLRRTGPVDDDECRSAAPMRARPGRSNAIGSYDVRSHIGKGSFGTVSIVQDMREPCDTRQSRPKYCLKQIDFDGATQTERSRAYTEARLLQSLDHPGIVAYRESFITEEGLSLIMECCMGGDLSQHIKRTAQARAHIGEHQILDWLIQITLALDYVHSKRILHRDLKAQNIFLTLSATIKLGDFGISKQFDGCTSAATSIVGTPYYMSPEMCRGHPCTYAADVWALGCVAFELCALQQAWSGTNVLAVVYKIVEHDPPTLPERYSSGLRDLIGRLLAKEPHARPRLAAVLEEPCVQMRTAVCLPPEGFASPMRHPSLCRAARTGAIGHGADATCVAPAMLQRQVPHNDVRGSRSRIFIENGDQCSDDPVHGSGDRTNGAGCANDSTGSTPGAVASPILTPQSVAESPTRVQRRGRMPIAQGMSGLIRFIGQAKLPHAKLSMRRARGGLEPVDEVGPADEALPSAAIQGAQDVATIDAPVQTIDEGKAQSACMSKDSSIPRVTEAAQLACCTTAQMAQDSLPEAWHYIDDEDVQQGPVDEEMLVLLHALGDINDDTRVWCEGMARWEAIRDVPGLISSDSCRPANPEVKRLAHGAAASISSQADCRQPLTPTGPTGEHLALARS